MQHAALNALRNSDASVPAEHLAALKRIAESRDGRVRQGGIAAIRRIHSSEARAYLVERLGAEVDAGVLTELAEAVFYYYSLMDATERARLVESMRAAVPYAVTESSCRGIATIAIELPSEEGTPLIVNLARNCTSEWLRTLLDRVLEAMQAGETQSDVLHRILWQEN